VNGGHWPDSAVGRRHLSKKVYVDQLFGIGPPVIKAESAIAEDVSEGVPAASAQEAPSRPGRIGEVDGPGSTGVAA